MASELRMEASTTATSENCTFKWTIKNYRIIKLKVGELIVSPNFGVGSDNKQYFNLQLYPGGVTTENTAYISLYLKALIDSTKKPDKLVCRWSVSVINDKKDIQKLTMHHDFATTNFKGRGWPQFFELAKIDQLISSENTVTIQCELEVFKEFKSSLDCPNIIDGENRTIDQVNFGDMFLSEEFSDVKIKISDTHEIPAHKAILAPASPLFMAMFRRDENSENKKSSVKITKPNKNTVIEMLQFIYTGEVDAIETDQIIKLLEVAHKYQIDNLKTKCGNILCGHLSSENAIDMLVTAHKYKLKNLEDEAIKFITNHTELLLNSENIKKIGDLGIMINLMQSIVKSQKNIS